MGVLRGWVTLSGRGQGRLNPLQTLHTRVYFQCGLSPPGLMWTPSPQPQRVKTPHKKVTFGRGHHPSCFLFPKGEAQTADAVV